MTRKAGHSCGARCLRDYGASKNGIRGHGEIAHLRLAEKKGPHGSFALVTWRGFEVTGRLCGHHQEEATHNLTDPKRDAKRFVLGSLVGRKTVAELCEKRKGAP